MLEAVGALGAPHPHHFAVAYGGGYVYPLSAFLRLSGRNARHGLDEYVAARAWSALLATLTVWIVYRTGARVGGIATGFLAAAILTCAPLAVREAHLAKADTASTFAAALLAAAITRPTAGIATATFIGAAGGLALSTKYLIGVLPAMLLALFRSGTGRQRGAGDPLSGACEAAKAVDSSPDRASPPNRSRAGGPPRPAARLSPTLIGIATAAAVVCALNVFALRAPAESWAELTTLVRDQRAMPERAWLAAAAESPLAYHATVSLRHGCGLAVALLALPALAVALRARGAVRLLAVLVLGQWLVLLANPMTVARNLLPSLPALAILVAWLADRATYRLPHPSRTVALAALAIALVAEPLVNTIGLGRVLRAPDTRTLAAAWIEERLPRDAVLALSGAPAGAPQYGVPGFGLPFVLSGRQLVADPAVAAADGRPAFLVWHHYPIPYSSTPLPASLAAGASLAVFDPFDGPAAPVVEPLDAFYVPLARFAGVRSPGPRLEIFRLGS